MSGDAELQAFARELSAQDGGRLTEVPVPRSVEQLKALISKLVFIAGPGHSAVNFAQYPFMGFRANMCGASFSPIPTIATASPLEDLERRGLTNTEALDNPYRDDVKLVWEALASYVGEYIDAYYPSDAAVSGDAELQAFARELSAQDGGRLTEVPVPQSVEQLKALISKLVFIAGPGHSAVNFAQYPFMGFQANMCGASFSPIPTPETPDDEAELTKMLPPLRIAMEGVTMIYFLSHMRPTKLGHYPPFHFRDHAARKAVHGFQKKLRSVEAAIDEAEPGRLLSYPFLKPSLILQSISI